MQTPNVKNIIKDPARNITYHVMAFRKLTRDELVNSVALYLSQKKVKKPKKGSLVTIITIIGYDQ